MAHRAPPRRPRERRTVKALYEQLKAAGYDGGYTGLTDDVRAWRLREGASVSTTKAFVPLAFELGEAFQFDWSEEGLVIGGIYRRLQVAHTKLCASRASWLVAHPSQGHEMLFDAHSRAFAALGGVARRGIYDNMKTAVDKVGKGKVRIVDTRFAALCAHDLIDADFCNVASGWEKGRVEKNVQVAVQRNRYSVPCELAGQMGSARLYPSRVVVVADDAVVASHERLSDRGQTRYDWQHHFPLVQRKPGALRNGAPFADMPEALQPLQALLLKHTGGDRVMAQALAAVPTAGLEAVLVAVELVLDSGAVSAEHVLNVLARLTAAAPPEPIDTALSLSEAPRADTDRYDAWRDQQADQKADDKELRHA